MLFGRLVIAVIVSFALTTAIQAQVSQSPDDSSPHYSIQPGDLLEISVWREEYLEKEVVVRKGRQIEF